MRSGSTVYYLLTDHLNSTARIVNSAGVIQSTQYFFPFGGNRGEMLSTLTVKHFSELFVCHTVREGTKCQLVDISVCRDRAKNYVCIRGAALSCSDRATHRVDISSPGVSVRATENELKQGYVKRQRRLTHYCQVSDCLFSVYLQFPPETTP